MTTKAKKARQEVIQMAVTDKDKPVLQNLRQKNRTLRDSDIFRMALHELAEKQGVLPKLADVS